MTSQTQTRTDHEIAVVSGAGDENGHLDEFRTDPVGLMQTRPGGGPGPASAGRCAPADRECHRCVPVSGTVDPPHPRRMPIPHSHMQSRTGFRLDSRRSGGNGRSTRGTTALLTETVYKTYGDRS